MRLLASTLFVYFAAVGAAPAAVIYSNLNTDPANLYQELFQWVLTDGSPRAQAMPFTAPGTFTVTQIDVPIFQDLGLPNAVQLSIAADASGVPGATLGSWTLGNLPQLSHISRNCCALASLLLPDTSMQVSAGSKYWLVATSIGTTVGRLWFWNNTGASAQSYHQDQTGNWVANSGSTLGAFDVIGDPAPVPEPASALTSLTGLLGFAAFCRRFRP